MRLHCSAVYLGMVLPPIKIAAPSPLVTPSQKVTSREPERLTCPLSSIAGEGVKALGDWAVYSLSLESPLSG